MKKMKVTLMSMGMALIAATSLTACDGLPSFNQQTQQNSMITKVSKAFSEEVSSGAVEMDAKIEIAVKSGLSKQSVMLELDAVENVKSQEADFTMKMTPDGKQEKAVYQDFYVRGKDGYKTEEYSAGEEVPGIIPLKNAEDIFKDYFSDLDMGFEMDLGQNANTFTQIYSLLTFGKEYNAVETKGSTLTFDINELVYNITTSLKPAYSKIKKTTKVREHFEEASVKRLIDTLAGGDTALEIYNDLKESSSSLTSEYIDVLKDYKPTNDQSLYEYVLYLLESVDFLEETDFASIGRQGQSLGDLRIYDILYKLGNAEKILGAVCTSIEQSTESKTKIALAETISEGYFSLEDTAIVFELDGDKAKSVTCTGNLEISAKGSDDVKRTIGLTLDYGVNYLEKEQQVRDLATMNYAKEAFFVTEDPYGFMEYLTPDTQANIRSVIKNRKIKGVIIKHEGQEQEAVYKPELGAYAYTIDGYDMLVEVENIPSTENQGDSQIRYVIYFNNAQKTPFNVFVKKFYSAMGGYYYVSKDMYAKTEKELTIAVDGINYKLNYDSKSYIVTGLADQNKKDVEIKSEVNGLPVKIIASGAFFNSSIESVKIPSSIISIRGAFSSCVNLRSVEAYCPIIDESAFNGCINLETINLAGVTRINKLAFYRLENLKNVSFGEKLFLVEDSAFFGCTNAQITIPTSLQYVGQTAFTDCYISTEVDLGNLITVGDSAFSDCKGVKKITIGAAANNSTYLFARCASLEEVIIQEGITSISEAAFYNCDNLKSVYYKGTAEDWAEIWIGSSNSKLRDATRYYYSETEPTEEGNYWHYGENGEVVIWMKESV